MNSYPVHVSAHRDDQLSRWLWLVKWVLLIPHYLVLVVLWIAFVVTTLVAYVAVVFTGRYPPAIFAFNTGVLRWSWRVNYYGYQALGTDRYPPFTLADVADYPARLHIEPPARSPRWLPLVAWLLAVPHLLLVAALTGSANWQFRDDASAAPIGAVSLGLLIAGISLLFTGRYPRGLYDLLLGIARWSLRVIGYVALLTDQYPPFRLDQGDDEPGSDPVGPASPTTARPADPGDVGPAVEPGPRGSVAAPVTALVAGVMMLLLAAGVGLGAATLIGLGNDRDANGYLTSPTLQVNSSTSAVTVEDINLHAGDLWTRHLSSIGGVRISATSATGTPLFVGIAPQAAVNSWLAGTAHDWLASPSPPNRAAATSAPAARQGPCRHPAVRVSGRQQPPERVALS
ncbi:DUF4389 domain-containing protein [Micromonosporaceae bacterium Da 78-11]